MEVLFLLVIVGAALAWWFLSRGGGLVSEQEARRLLASGALVIDVRSEDEFRQKHLSAAINIPLDQLPQKIAVKVPDKEKVLLLHCLAGGRSGLARRKLRQLGYNRSYNLGSFNRAARLVEAPAPAQG
jgi:phage shock protein E